MNWLHETITDSRTGKASAKRVVMLLGALAMAAAIVILAVAALFGHDVGVAITGVCASLAGLSGYGYVNGKLAEKT